MTASRRIFHPDILGETHLHHYLAAAIVFYPSIEASSSNNRLRIPIPSRRRTPWPAPSNVAGVVKIPIRVHLLQPEENLQATRSQQRAGALRIPPFASSVCSPGLRCLPPNLSSSSGQSLLSSSSALEDGCSISATLYAFPTLHLRGRAWDNANEQLQVRDITVDYTECLTKAPNVTALKTDQFDPMDPSFIKANFLTTNSSFDPNRAEWQLSYADVEYAPDSIISEPFCTIRFNIPETIGPSVLFYYNLQNFYQNHRRYVQSFDAKQLNGDAVSWDDINNGANGGASRSRATRR